MIDNELEGNRRRMSTAPESDELRWRKSTRSGANGCVEAAITPRLVAVRDSKDPDGPVLQFSRDAWRGFVASVRSSAFDPHGSSRRPRRRSPVT
jgi:hypothetical protein